MARKRGGGNPGPKPIDIVGTTVQLSKDSLQPYYDAKLRTRNRQPVDIALEERCRLLSYVVMAEAVESMKRRLGGDATPEELAADKAMARRVQHSLTRIANYWGDEPCYPDPKEVQRKAAQVDWPTWFAEAEATVRSRRVYIANWAIRWGYRLEAKKFINRLNNEERELARLQNKPPQR